MLSTLATDWNQIVSQAMVLWLIGWGVRALLVILLLGGLYWIFRKNR